MAVFFGGFSLLLGFRGRRGSLLEAVISSGNVQLAKSATNSQ